MENPHTPEITGKYTKIERDEFDKQLGPGAAVALESLRKQAKIRIKVTRRSSGLKSTE